jgi:hypothetical protein
LGRSVLSGSLLVVEEFNLDVCLECDVKSLCKDWLM